MQHSALYKKPKCSKVLLWNVLWQDVLFTGKQWIVGTNRIKRADTWYDYILWVSWNPRMKTFMKNQWYFTHKAVVIHLCLLIIYSWQNHWFSFQNVQHRQPVCLLNLSSEICFLLWGKSDWTGYGLTGFISRKIDRMIQSTDIGYPSLLHIK